ncbi:MAG: FAD-binding oxidoreductase [Desulfovibrio sp.]|uniref:FAD-binding oxidoreductase n=1 Tax=Desulfovibrio sp. 7SRBS1 TaxID=3378064 RepID=UPI003B41CF89
MLSKKHIRFLQDSFSKDALRLEPEACATHSTDSSRILALPDAVVRPETEQEVEILLSWAHRERIPVYPRARATGVAGGVVPQKGGIVVSTLRMNRIIEISADDFTATVEPGVVTGELQKILEAQNLFYPPDPASVNISTIGGNASTCAGGLRAVKYGVTRDYILGLNAVLPGGKTIRTGKPVHKNVAGLDLTRLLVGSEGTLGIITKLILKLLPKPEATASILVGFKTLGNCLQAASTVFHAGFLPTAMEFMDNKVLDALADVAPSVPWTGNPGGALLFRLDGSRAALAADLERLHAALSTCDPLFLEIGDTPETEEELWEVRRLISPALYSVAPNKSNDDIAVPRSQVANAVRAFHDIGEQNGLNVVCFGHLGDGNIHVDIMYDAEQPGVAQKAKTAKEQIYDAVIRLNGTLSGEHGIGMVKRPYIHKQFGPNELNAMAAIKHALDPHNIMNPDKAY